MGEETEKPDAQKPMTKEEIEQQLKTNFPNLSEKNRTILINYMLKNTKKWKKEEFNESVNKLMPEAFASNLRPSNALFGAIIAVIVILLIGVIWWVVSMLVKKNDKNVLNDPTIVNPTFI